MIYIIANLGFPEHQQDEEEFVYLVEELDGRIEKNELRMVEDEVWEEFTLVFKSEIAVGKFKNHARKKFRYISFGRKYE